jgi:hypothetical protein
MALVRDGASRVLHFIRDISQLFTSPDLRPIWASPASEEGPVLGVSGALPTPKAFCYPLEPPELDRSHGNNTLVTTAR